MITFGYLSKNFKNIYSQRNMAPYVHCSIIHRGQTWKQPNCLWTEDWIGMWYIYTMEEHSAIRKGAVLPFETNTLYFKWMLKYIIALAAVAQSVGVSARKLKDLGFNLSGFKLFHHGSGHLSKLWVQAGRGTCERQLIDVCLLYTSDAADEVCRV